MRREFIKRGDDLPVGFVIRPEVSVVIIAAAATAAAAAASISGTIVESVVILVISVAAI